MQITELPKSKYAGFTITASYTSRAHYDMTLRSSGVVFQAQLTQIANEPSVREFECPLFAPDLEDPHLWGVIDNGQLLVGMMEVSPDSAKNILRITNLCVQDGYRRRGLGKMLVSKAINIAQSQRRRAIYCDVQSWNNPAISMLLKTDFQFCGFEMQADDDHTVIMKFRHSV